jgi:hypothetical protein
MRYVVIGILVLIVASLASAFVSMVRDKGRTDRAVKALTLRVALSIGLFVMLMLGHYLGWMPSLR